MKKALFCILIVGVNSALGMSQDAKAIEFGKRTLEELDLYIKRYKPRDAFYHKQLANFESQMAEFEGDVRSYLDMVHFVIQTMPEHACDPDEGGTTPIQKLLAFPVPSVARNALISCAMWTIQRTIPEKWVFCHYWVDKHGLRAKEEKLRFELMRNCHKPCCFRKSTIFSIAREISKVGNLDDFRTFEGYGFFEKIDDMREHGQICSDEYRSLWISTETGAYLERKKAEHAVVCGKRLVEGPELRNLRQCFKGYPEEVLDAVQKEVYYWNVHKHQLKGGKKAFIELILFAVERSRSPWQCDETGFNAVQRLMAYPVPADDPEAQDAMRKTKEAVMGIWMKRPRSGAASGGGELPSEREEKEDNRDGQEIDYEEIGHQEPGAQAGAQVVGHFGSQDVNVDAQLAELDLHYL